jgi:NAD(P)-dependent dehydrogenase (short-subunit alcohol dehydrogenase family)
MARPKVAMVTGGGRGLGLACAERLAEDGYGVALLDRNEEAARAAAAGLAGDDERHLGMGGDVTRRENVEAALALTSGKLGVPTVLVNGAGILYPTAFLEISDDEWRSVVDVSLTGSFISAQVCLPGMIEAEFGRIVNFSSTAGKNVSTIGGAHYTAAKAGVLGLTRALAKESAEFGVTVNAICPGLIDTDMARENCTPEALADYAASFPVSRLGAPEEIAALVAFLCGVDAGYITGAALDINGGDLMV